MVSALSRNMRDTERRKTHANAVRRKASLGGARPRPLLTDQPLVG